MTTTQQVYGVLIRCKGKQSRLATEGGQPIRFRSKGDAEDHLSLLAPHLTSQTSSLRVVRVTASYTFDSK